MASNQNYVDYVVEQLSGLPEVEARKMFGEYGIYSDGKMFGVICDNQLFIKPTTAGRDFIGQVTEAPPYPGAKPSFLIKDQLEDRKWLSELVLITLQELPQGKPKRRK